jgi:hypothetical protein
VRVIHTLPPPEFINAGGDLLHEESFIREPLGTFRWDDSTGTAVRIDGDDMNVMPIPLTQPPAGTETMPAPQAAMIPLTSSRSE